MSGERSALCRKLGIAYMPPAEIARREACSSGPILTPYAWKWISGLVTAALVIGGAWAAFT